MKMSGVGFLKIMGVPLITILYLMSNFLFKKPNKNSIFLANSLLILQSNR
jgi:hypothetical protein